MASASASKKEQRLQMFPNSPKPGASKPLREDRDFDETSILWHAQKRERAVERGQANSALFSNMQLNAGIVGNTATVLLNVQIDDSAMAGIGSHMVRGTQAARKGRPVGETETGTSRLTDGTIHGLLQVLPHLPAGPLRHRQSLDAIKLPDRQLLGHLESSRRSMLKWMDAPKPWWKPGRYAFATFKTPVAAGSQNEDAFACPFAFCIRLNQHTVVYVQ